MLKLINISKMEKNFKILIILGIIIILGFVFGFGYWYFSVQKQKAAIEKTILSSLEEKLEFCEIIKSDISGDNGKFWLICNNRPFYTEYINGEVKYELNGWGFLKQDPAIWEDLESCDFYNSEKIENNYNLTFYCPRKFDVGKITAKIYQFDTSSQRTTKIGEKNFLDVLDKDIKNIHSFLKECNIKSFTSKPEWEPPSLFLNYSCGERSWGIFYLYTMILLPPIAMDDNLSYEERAKESFEKTFGCQIKDINSVGNNAIINSICDNKELVITYRFSEIPTANYVTKCEKPCLEIGKYFILPVLGETKEAIFIKDKIHQTPVASIYKVGNKVIEIGVIENNLVLFWQKPEGFYYGVYYE